MSTKTPFFFREGLNRLASRKDDTFTLMHKCSSPWNSCFTINDVLWNGHVRYIQFVCQKCHLHAMDIAASKLVDEGDQPPCGCNGGELTVASFDTKKQELVLKCPDCQSCQAKFTVLGVSDN